MPSTGVPPVGRKTVRAVQGQLTLSGLHLEQRGPEEASLTKISGAEGPSAPSSGPVECLWGCRGTPECLCGQGELSDDPLWIEND